MVSTGMETAYATVSGPGFDSQQVHKYSFHIIFCVTKQYEKCGLQPHQPTLRMLKVGCHKTVLKV